MPTLEILIIVVLVGAAVMGYRRGAVKQLGSIFGIAIGLVVCHLFGDVATIVASKMLGYGEDASALEHYTATTAGHIGLFVLVWIGVLMGVRLLHGIIGVAHLGPINRLAGAAVMLLKWGLAVSIFMNLLKMANPGNEVFGEGAAGVARVVTGFAPWLLGALT